MTTIEKQLSRLWHWFALGAIAAYALGCASSRVAYDPVTGEEVIVTEGEHILPGAADAIEDTLGVPVEDIVGAAGDAVSSINPGEIIEDVSSGNWLAVAGAAVAVIGGIVCGVACRRKVRKKRVV